MPLHIGQRWYWNNGGVWPSKCRAVCGKFSAGSKIFCLCERRRNYPSRMSLLSPDISSVKDHVKNILYANTASKRHTLFNSNKKADLLHLSCNICSLFSPSMIRRFTLEVQSFLPEFWPEFNHRNTRMASYVLSVLIPEAIVYVMTIREGCSRHSVERLLGTLENEINTQEEETDEDD
ncbi:uncharacterized protein LOC141890026 [Acropora palmata]|uniref:uncharacterized protein LOC141890026 n=1 Tax=Acropora palmata TaxID=6131 RepID=UPI003DA17BC6